MVDGELKDTVVTEEAGEVNVVLLVLEWCVSSEGSRTADATPDGHRVLSIHYSPFHPVLISESIFDYT